MEEKKYVAFTEEMKKDYTILVPTMLPMHFQLIISILSAHGYNMELLESSGSAIIETGLRYVHNDACYPSILVIGQFMHAILSGKYDPHKVALVYFQTGGGCRASNYVSLLRKALARAGYDYIPVIAFSFNGIERHPGFDISPIQFAELACGIVYGDLMMTLRNQIIPYETNRGDSDRVTRQWVDKLGKELSRGRGLFSQMDRNMRAILKDFAVIPRSPRDTVRVGIVGEIFVKYSPLGNNNLEEFLIAEGAEPDVPGMIDFFLYCLYNNVMDYRLYKRVSPLVCLGNDLGYRFICRLKRKMIRLIKEQGIFRAPTPFEETLRLAKDYLSLGTKMGEGWLLTGEMLELARSGTGNIICTQPFGCLPNHIVGKGMMKPIRDRNPDVNIIAIDYDPGATRVNQENRIKLMLANARRIKNESAKA